MLVYFRLYPWQESLVTQTESRRNVYPDNAPRLYGFISKSVAEAPCNMMGAGDVP